MLDSTWGGQYNIEVRLEECVKQIAIRHFFVCEGAIAEGCAY